MHYKGFDGVPDDKTMAGILHLHASIFGHTKGLADSIEEKPRLRIDVALDGEKVIGYKMGYALDYEKFYSWLGCVDYAYRNQGIASKLMEKQHQYVRDCGYKAVQTKTKNKWRSMLILNIKNGFDVIGTYTDDEGEPKIILEKKL